MRQQITAPRILISACKSGSGKTLITCGILQAFCGRGWKTAAFKCGPDYIDPLFHTNVIGTKSKNLDLYFSETEQIKQSFALGAVDAQISILEGVMGYYDGIGGTSTEASSYDLAKTLDIPVVLVVDCSGMSVSMIPQIQGMLQYKPDTHICGVILNRISKQLYFQLKPQIEQQLSIEVLGYVPSVPECIFSSRYLGLVLPEEIENLKEKLKKLAMILEDTISLDRLAEIAEQAPPVSWEQAPIFKIEGNPRIAVAKDSAFCFYYEDNLHLLERMGAELIFFSPITDKAIPEGADGVLFGGGYPELYAEQLEQNRSMRKSVKTLLERGLPCLAECGGFLYLHDKLEGADGVYYHMAEVIHGCAFKPEKQSRFGYVELISLENQLLGKHGDTIKGHEFHYWESDFLGKSFLAKKPSGSRKWECIFGSDTMAVGFPHLYYYSNPSMVERFLRFCVEDRERNCKWK